MRLTPTTLKQLCDEYGLVPSKKYGQNYLISDAPIQKMIEAAELTREDVVIEIGPGFGILTFSLAEQVKKVIAFEIERKLERYWDEKKKKYPNIEIVWGNALSLISKFKFQSSNFKVLANLPYSITSHALQTLLELEHKPDRIIVMVQKEVGERICAKPGDMSLLAVSVQYYGNPHVVCKVARGNFWPSPNVDSVVIQINMKTEQHLNTCNNDFFRVVKAGFSHKRKLLTRNISSQLNVPFDFVVDAVKKIIGNENARAEELSVLQWEQLAKLLTGGEAHSL